MARIRSAAQKAALRKAQLASARKRRGKGKPKPVRKRRSVAAAKASNVRKRRGVSSAKSSGVKRRSVSSVKAQNAKKNRRKAIAIGVGAVGAAAVGAAVYKNREKLIIARVAEFSAVKNHERRLGRKLNASEKRAVRLQERKDHASRSTYRVREYLSARKTAIVAYQKLGANSLNPNNKNSMDKVINSINPGSMSRSEARYVFMQYRRDVYSRAQQRLARIQGKKRRFNYNSGKRLKVSPKGVVKQTFW